MIKDNPESSMERKKQKLFGKMKRSRKKKVFKEWRKNWTVKEKE